MKSLIIEIEKIRHLMELTNTEIKVRFRKGLNFINVTTMPENNNVETFVGTETGKIIQDQNLESGKIKALLDDGRFIVTTEDAIDGIQNMFDANTKDDLINVGTNDGGTYSF
jgi:hypothetical protein